MVLKFLLNPIKSISRPANKYLIGGLVIVGAVLFFPAVQKRAATGSSILTSISTSVSNVFNAVLPFDIIGNELAQLGGGFRDFGVGIGEGFSGLFSPLTSFIDFAQRITGYGNPASPVEQEEIG
jgi:hypothetical protein